VQVMTQQEQPQETETVSTDTATTTRRIPIFGLGHRKRLSEQWGIEHTFSIPLLDQIATNGDAGTPYVLQHPDSAPSAIFKSLASTVVTEVAKIKHAAKTGTSSNNKPNVEYNQDEHMLVVDQTDRLVPAVLRRSCRCAACVEELTGRQLLVPTTVPDTVAPKKLYPTGNYALSVDWSDGHRSLYPYRQIRALVASQNSDHPLIATE
jgi:DUF971 family protein